MNLKKRLLSKSGLYVIIDKTVLKKKSLGLSAEAIKNSGADIVQLRDKGSDTKNFLKEAEYLRNIFRESQVLFIINDRADIAAAVDSDGVHLGQNDLPVHAARSLLGKNKIIGVSCHSIHQALMAQEEGADYIGIGPIFPTGIKPHYKATGVDILRLCGKKIRIPFFPIGGITQNNINEIFSAGVKRIVVCGAVCRAPSISNSVEKFKLLLKKGQK